ncbi:MAG: ABC transporter ATP-binding protein [Candidatus Woesearchaeota archaeon]
MEILNLKEVTKVFGKRVILDRVSFVVEEGDIFGILGQSGSGKTTLLNLIIGFYQPDEGSIMYQLDPNDPQKSVHQHANEVKRKFGFAAQLASFYPKLTIKENLVHFGNLYGIEKKTLQQNIQSLLEFTRLEKSQDQLAEQTSVGMQKRLDLSCSLIHKPKILLLDEPTANIDPLLRKEILYLIQQANKQGITVIIASHQLSDIESICNKVALIHNRRVAAWGTLEEIKRPYIQKDGAIHLNAGDYHQQILDEARNMPVSKIVDQGDSILLYSAELQKVLCQLMNFAQREKIILNDINIHKPSLKEVFEEVAKKAEDEH